MKTILYATDCTTKSASALRCAYRFSSIMNADLHVLHVYELPPLTFSLINSTRTLKKRMQEEQSDIVKQYCKSQLKNEFLLRPVTVHALENVSISKSIFDISKGLSPDLIIIGTKDSNTTRGYFSNNIANELLDIIEVPLLIVPNGIGHDFNRLSTIVYATDFEDADFLAIEKLIKIASPFEALIEIIHIYETDEYAAIECMKRFKNTILKKITYPEIRFRTIAFSKVKSGLLSVVKNENATMLAMLERKRPRGFNLLARKDLVKDMETSISIPLLAFNK